MNSSSGRSNRYPRHVSDRADDLIEEIDEGLSGKLYKILRTLTYADWMAWLERNRKAVFEYDALPDKQRFDQLYAPDNKEALRDALMLHHACVFLELCRARVGSMFPPHTPDATDRNGHRELILAAYVSVSDADPLDYWPFEVPAQCSPWPFSDD